MRNLLLASLFALTACNSVTISQDQPTAHHPSATQSALADPASDMIGRTRTDVQMAYGTPSKVSGKKGFPILEYAVHSKFTYSNGKSEMQRCTLRFSLAKDRVTKVDDQGVHDACVFFAQNKKI